MHFCFVTVRVLNRYEVLLDNTRVEGRKLPRVFGGGAENLPGLIIRKIDIVRGYIDVGVISPGQYLKAGAVVFYHAKGRIIFVVALVKDCAAVNIEEVNAVSGESDGIVCLDVGVHQSIVLVYIQIIDIVVAGDNGFIAVAVIDFCLLVSGGVILIESAVLLRAVGIEVLSQGTAGKDIRVVYLLFVGSVDAHLIEGCSLLLVIVQVIDIVADEGGIDAGIRIQYGDIPAVSGNTAETVIGEGEKAEAGAVSVIVSHIVDVVGICVDVHDSVIAELL